MSIHEECGVFGVFSGRMADVANISYYGLYALQHRGQESCGIVVNDDGLFVSHKDLGLVSEVFSKNSLSSFPKRGSARYAPTIPGAVVVKRNSLHSAFVKRDESSISAPSVFLFKIKVKL